MNNLETLIADAKNELLNNPLIVEYFRLKQSIENDKELISLIDKRKKAQLRMCKNENDDEIYLSSKSEYEALDSQIKSHPVMVNFKQVEEDVYVLLNQVKEVLEK